MTSPARTVPIDPNIGIPDLVRRLADDSKQLLGDEVRLAKLEAKESLRHVSKGVLWMALAFGVAVVMLVGVTLLLSTLIGRLASGHMWVGALVTGVLELVAALFLIKRGIGAFRTDAYSLPGTRAAAKEIAAIARNPRQA